MTLNQPVKAYRLAKTTATINHTLPAVCHNIKGSPYNFNEGGPLLKDKTRSRVVMFVLPSRSPARDYGLLLLSKLLLRRGALCLISERRRPLFGIFCWGKLAQ